MGGWQKARNGWGFFQRGLKIFELHREISGRRDGKIEAIRKMVG